MTTASHASSNHWGSSCKVDDRDPTPRRGRYRCCLPALAEFTVSGHQARSSQESHPMRLAAERVGFEPTVVLPLRSISSAVRSTGLRHLSVMFNRLRFDASIRLKSNPLECRLIQSPPDPFDVPGYLGKHQRSFLNPSLTRVLRSKDIPTGFWAYPRDLPAHQTLMVSNVYSAVPLSWHITPSPLPLPV